MASYTTLRNTETDTVEIHPDGCSHIARRTSSRNWIVVGANEEFANRWDCYISYNADFYAEGGKENCWHIDFKPCCKALPNGTWPSEYNVR